MNYIVDEIDNMYRYLLSSYLTKYLVLNVLTLL